jgi:hypothetical protein
MFNDAGTEMSIGFSEADALTNPNAGCNTNVSGVSLCISNDGFVTGAFTVVSMDPDGFTLNWNDAAGAAYVMHMLCLGGSDLTGYTIFTFNTPTSTGDFTAASGLGYTPEALLLAGFRGTSNGLGGIGLGFCDGTNQFALSAGMDDVANLAATDVYRHQRSDCVLTGPDGGIPSTEDYRCSFVSFGSGTVTLNASNAASAGVPIIGVALAGGQYKVGTDTQKTSTGVQAKDVGFPLSGVLFAGCNAAANSSVDTAAMKLSVGGSDGVNEGFAWMEAVDNVNPSQVSSRHVTDKAFGHSTADTTTNAEADCAFSGNTYELNWTTADATDDEFGYFGFGSDPAATALRDPVMRGLVPAPR